MELICTFYLIHSSSVVRGQKLVTSFGPLVIFQDAQDESAALEAELMPLVADARRDKFLIIIMLPVLLEGTEKFVISSLAARSGLRGLSEQ